MDHAVQTILGHLHGLGQSSGQDWLHPVEDCALVVAGVMTSNASPKNMPDRAPKMQGIGFRTQVMRCS